MRGLAGRLGVQAASLYGHVPTKQDVLDLVANLLTAQVVTSDFTQGWRPGLETWARSYLAPLRAHPHAAPIVAAGAGHRAEFLAMANQVHGGLVGGGWPPRHATMIAAAVKYLVIGAASTPFATGFADDSAVYRDRYPHLTQAHLLAERADEIESASFELALGRLLDGLQTLYDQLQLAPHPPEDRHVRIDR